MGVAYATDPEGLYEKASSYVLADSHEVLVWWQDGGIASLASINSSISIAPDGVNFEVAKTGLSSIPKAPGLYRPHLEDGNECQSGISMKVTTSEAYLHRYEMN